MTLTFTAIFLVGLQMALSACATLSPQHGIQQMKPLELEEYLDKLSPVKRQRFVAHLLKVGVTDEHYLSTLTSKEKSQYRALLDKLKSEN